MTTRQKFNSLLIHSLILSLAYSFIFLFGIQTCALADLKFLPEKFYSNPTISTTQFHDPYLGFFARGNKRTIGNIGVSVPFFAWDEDQIFVESGVEVTLRNAGATFFSESLDLRVGFIWTHPISKKLWLALGMQHTSGHVMDDVLEKNLTPLNVGIDGIPFRLVYNPSSQLRMGLHGVGSVGSDPVSRTIAGGSFFEYRFFEPSERIGFFVASDIYLPENLFISVSTNEQIGYSYHKGNLILGYHSGADTRLKHQLYLGSRADFWYAGVSFEI